MENKDKRSRITVFLSAPLYKEVEEYAKRTERSMSSAIRYLVKKGLEVEKDGRRE